MKTHFIRFIGRCAINGHGVELREREDGRPVLRHERFGKHSGAARSFRDADHLVSYLDSKEAEGAALLNQVLGDMGVSGFPAN